MILDTTSLMKTIDNINEKYLFGMSISHEEGLEAARWIVTRQGKMGAYRDMFAPTQADFERGIHYFTGEKLVSASARHILGQEAARAIWLLGNSDPTIRDAYHHASTWMHENLELQQSGTFCCGRCTLATWRHFWVSDFDNKESVMLKGLQVFKNSRIGDGNWRTFPFYYAIYTLVDIHLEPALAELKYARPVLERDLKKTKAGTYSKRRRAIIEKALKAIR